MATEISAKLALTREEIAYLYQGGVISLKIKGKEGSTSLEISCGEASSSRSTHIRFKHLAAV
jgi:hypothetical protein